MQEGIVVAPGSSFGAGGEGYVRVALVPDLDQCTLAIDRWAALKNTSSRLKS
jgi:aspartate/methionine/tyrosine aminotransferase